MWKNVEGETVFGTPGEGYLYQDAHCTNQNTKRIADQIIIFEALLLLLRMRQTIANTNKAAQIIVNQPAIGDSIWLSPLV